MSRSSSLLTQALPVSAASLAFVVAAFVGAGIDADLHRAEAAPRFWYYCDNPAGYFPYIQSCNGQYRAVPVPDDYSATTAETQVAPKHHHHHHKHITSLTGATAPAAASSGSAGAASPPPADLDDPGSAP